jgi:hypothetical protein
MFMRMLDMSNDSHLFRDAPGDGKMPLHEAKMMWQFDHRFATYDNECNVTRDLSSDEKADPALHPRPRYWVDECDVLNRTAPPTAEEQEALADGSLQSDELLRRQRDRSPKWLLGFRDITNSVSERTAIFSLLPRTAVGNNAPLLLTPNTATELVLCLAGNLNSVVFDYCAKQKVGGNHMNFFILEQLPVLPPRPPSPRLSPASRIAGTRRGGRGCGRNWTPGLPAPTA